MPRSRSITKPWLSYFRLETENSIVNSRVRFAIEELPQQLLLGACLEVEEERFDRNEMRRLYDSTDFPLARRAAA